MSIEAKIDALIIALNLNTAALTGKATPAAQPAKDAAQPAKKAADLAPPAGEVKYDDVKTPFLKLVGKARDAALAILKPYGYENLKVAKPEHFAPILAAVTKALADLEAAA